MSFDVLIVGIGSQGTVLTSNILGEACVIEGIPVRGAEAHGMAQRGGSVESQIRIGQEYGPLIAPGTADIIISLDLMEAARACHYLKEGGQIFTSKEYVTPTTVFMQDFPAPDEQMLLSLIGHRKVTEIDAKKLAEDAGSILTLNTVMLGAASRCLPLKEQSLRDAISKTVPKKTIEMNLKAFDLGKTAGSVQ